MKLHLSWLTWADKALQNNLTFLNTELSHSFEASVIPEPQYAGWMEEADKSITLHTKISKGLRQKLDGIDISFCL